ncbi:MAG TPA: Rrf2 family transcriptional regulator, partial [Thermodesulfobacteriota bacterium]|nr:Rrf2 family transcriptional regulator [Thermodesulfobacteriota bacterium]
YRLRLSPAEIPLLSVVEAVIGKIFLNDCLMQPGSCKRSGTCSIHNLWEKAKNQLRDTLGEITFEQLLKEEHCLLP